MGFAKFSLQTDTGKFLIETDRASNEKITSNLIYEEPRYDALILDFIRQIALNWSPLFSLFLWFWIFLNINSSAAKRGDYSESSWNAVA